MAANSNARKGGFASEHAAMRIRLMNDGDIPEGMRLKDLAGWNQTATDWERFLLASPDGCFVAEENGGVVGTVTTITYENCFSWIGMVLVDPEFRGRGIGRALLEQAIEFLASRGVASMGLDATPQGKLLYERLGFKVECELERWRLRRPSAPREYRDIKTFDLKDVLRLDREVFGADRSVLLQSLADAAPEFVQILRAQTGARGYTFGRHGAHSDHLGPWVADDIQSASELLDTFLERSARESVIVDCPRANPWAIGLAAERGFEFTRPLTRMWRGREVRVTHPQMVCGILGPEFG
jgi:GNAT superfamily N-acetyltransferase